jgi:ATP-dependent RNA helicase SUPV3L1/SUV3
MTSLTGSAGEDFASILRALGYRMERRPAPPPKLATIETAPVEAAPAETAPLDGAAPGISPREAVPPEGAPADAIVSEPAALEPVAATETDDVADGANDLPPASEERVVSSATLLPDVAFSPVVRENEAAAVEASSIEVLPDSAVSTETPALEAPKVEAVAETAAESVSIGDSAPAEAGAANATAPGPAPAPEMVEVWRPGGRSEERRPRHDRSRHRHPGHQDRPQEGTQPVAAAGETNDGAKGERHRRGRRDRNQDFRKPRTDAPVEAAAIPADGAPPREDRGRPPRERFEGKGRDQNRDQGRDKGKSGGGREKGGRDKRPDGGPSHRQFATSAPPRERERPVDPNSPFAKLAALREQLTANRKDR